SVGQTGRGDRASMETGQGQHTARASTRRPGLERSHGPARCGSTAAESRPGDAARRPADAVAGALAIGAQAACITPPPDPRDANAAARRTDAHPADPAPTPLRVEPVSPAPG